MKDTVSREKYDACLATSKKLKERLVKARKQRDNAVKELVRTKQLLDVAMIRCEKLRQSNIALVKAQTVELTMESASKKPRKWWNRGWNA